ncbi:MULTISPECIES: hypothetical protein [Selenomonas]|jgi:hypothetical protein|uniref:Uncharacterized protein n=1 Tax=Selenomonas sputigena (strain ATCC 35185 / DSM 20758 / CCUG 44933 / VPI D19B-28) TaxID=546271 RepID=F4EYY5_SELS3|nr:hypothetical protein [Selenomonas sputigena]AEB99542.1 hypothetical protein Selsp_0570 [Selenomonas sputigena ATCC 35185]
MDRKDNIYITRRNRTDASIELLNYASEIKRNDVKKSDVILLLPLYAERFPVHNIYTRPKIEILLI